MIKAAMAIELAQDIQHTRTLAHNMLDLLPPEKLTAISGLLETMIDPVERALAAAPIDDEPVTEAEAQSIAGSRQWFKQNKGTPFDQAMAELGLTDEEVKNYQEPS